MTCMALWQQVSALMFRYFSPSTSFMNLYFAPKPFPILAIALALFLSPGVMVQSASAADLPASWKPSAQMLKTAKKCRHITKVNYGACCIPLRVGVNPALCKPPRKKQPPPVFLRHFAVWLPAWRGRLCYSFHFFGR